MSGNPFSPKLIFGNFTYQKKVTGKLNGGFSKSKQICKSEPYKCGKEFDFLLPLSAADSPMAFMRLDRAAGLALRGFPFETLAVVVVTVVVMKEGCLLLVVPIQ